MRNKFEKRIDKQLKKLKVKYSYESEKIPYVIAAHYIPDFILETPTGKIYIECKGYFRATDKRKLRAVRKCNPERDIRLLFYRDHEPYKRWADKNGIKWAVEKVPEEWINGL